MSQMICPVRVGCKQAGFRNNQSHKQENLPGSYFFEFFIGLQVYKQILIVIGYTVSWSN